MSIAFFAFAFAFAFIIAFNHFRVGVARVALQRCDFFEGRFVSGLQLVELGFNTFKLGAGQLVRFFFHC